MNKNQNKESLIPKIQVALDQAIANVIAETKAKNSWLVYADKKGNIIKVHAKDLKEKGQKAPVEPFLNLFP
jgi:hypothetical protein